MDNPETQAIISTRQRRKTNKTKNGQPKDTGNIFLFVFILCLVPNIACVSGLSILYFICLRSVSCVHYCLCLCVVHSLFYLFSSCLLCLILPLSLCCPFFFLFDFAQAVLSTRQRRKTNKTKNGQPRDRGNIEHKTQDEDK
jgi:hypothetical protein